MDFDDQPQQSCWRIAAYTLGAFAVVLVAAYLFGGFETTIAVADAG